MSVRIIMVPILLLVFIFASTFQRTTGQERLDTVAEAYVKLVLNVGLYDPLYVDAYYGPQEWKPNDISDEEKENFPYYTFLSEVENLLDEMKKIETSKLDDIWKRRYKFLEKHLQSVKGKIELLSGKKMTFDEESKILYDVIAPEFSDDYFVTIINNLDEALPGDGTIHERYEEFKKAYIIPKEKVDDIFKTALSECRTRTLKYLKLPENERFLIEYVTDKPWGAYNWYKGNAYSVIQFNTDVTSAIDRALAVTSHEGYPGHHVHNLLIEMNLYHGRNWVEFSVYPLYSPISLIAEGVAEYGINLIFPDNERSKYEREVLFPLAGFDTTGAANYYKIKKIAAALQSAGVEVARRYLDGNLNKEDAIKWLSEYALRPPGRAQNSLQFIERYRSYIINYTVGELLIKNYIEKHGGSEDDRQKRWQLFAEILSQPYISSDLQ
jgi:hypothetical protein